MRKIRKAATSALLAIAMCLSATASAGQCAHKAVCVSAGPTSHICSLCNAELRHDIVARVVAPTCSTVGYTMDVCAACAYEGAQYDILPVDPSAHVFGDWTVVAEPSCTQRGQRERLCALCGWKQTEETARAAHSIVPVVHAPDCRNDGYTEQVCSVCGTVVSVGETVPRSAAYHRWSAFTETAQPGCETEGEQERVCLTCGAKHRQMLPAAGHMPFVATYPPDCVHDGYTVTVCGVCGKELDARRAPVLHGAAYHRYGEWIQVSASTCISHGERVRHCEICRTADVAVAALLPHDPVECVVPATFRSDGYTVSVCRSCNAEIGARCAFVPAGMYAAAAEETPVLDAPVTGADTAVLRTVVSARGEVARTLALTADGDCRIELDANDGWFADNGVDTVELLAQGVLLRITAKESAFMEVRASRLADGMHVLVRTNISNAGFDETTGEYRKDGAYRVMCDVPSGMALYGRELTVLLPGQTATCVVAPICGD